MQAAQLDPRQEYSHRLEARRRLMARYDRRHRWMGNARVATFFAAAVIAWAAFGHSAMSRWWLLLSGSVFFGLVPIHERVLRRRDLAARSVSYYERSLARLDDRWAGTGERGERFASQEHPYALDLDLFGAGSVFELISAARTRMGEEALAGWLLGPASPVAVRERQAAVDELRVLLDFREDLAVLGEDVRVGVNPQMLAAWGERQPLLNSQHIRARAAILSALGVLALGAFFAYLLSGLGAFELSDRIAAGLRVFFLLGVTINLLYLTRYRRVTARVIHEVEEADDDLKLLSLILVRLEQTEFRSPRLVRLRSDLDAGGLPPSRRMARLNRLVELLDSRHNWIMRLFGPVLLWDLQLSLAVEEWRGTSGQAVRGWLAATGEMEALSSLGRYSYEHPADPFPEFTEESPCLHAEGISHPLIPESRAVPNDVSLGGDLRLLVVSGSNMSGKSTLLRTLGVNAVLAQAGAPVRARRMRLSPLEVGASIRVVDSLQGGASRFYAEIQHLRRILERTAETTPVLFLLDEFLHGTNSHDRRIGSEAIVRSLLDRGAIGIVTTHDLALAEIADSLAPRGANAHFQDHIEGGHMSFDYRMQPGVVTKSNALELMRAVGLPV